MNKWQMVDSSVPDGVFVLAYFGPNNVHSIEFEVYEGKLYAWNEEGEVYNDLPSHWMPLPDDPLNDH